MGTGGRRACCLGGSVKKFVSMEKNTSFLARISI